MHCDCLDFPCSWDFYRSHCWEVHGYDPGPNFIIEEDKETTRILREMAEPHFTKAAIALPPNAFQELSARFNHLQNQYNNHIDIARKNEKI